MSKFQKGDRVRIAEGAPTEHIGVEGTALLHEWPVVLIWRHEKKKASLQITVYSAQDYLEERPIPDQQLA